MASRARTLLIPLFAAALTFPLSAHDFWIDPSSFEPDVASLVRIGLRVGPGFDVDPVARDSRAIESFFVAGPSGRQDVLGMDGGNPAGVFRVSTPGTFLIAYRSHPTPLK